MIAPPGPLGVKGHGKLRHYDVLIMSAKQIIEQMNRSERLEQSQAEAGNEGGEPTLTRMSRSRSLMRLYQMSSFPSFPLFIFRIFIVSVHFLITTRIPRFPSVRNLARSISQDGSFRLTHG